MSARQVSAPLQALQARFVALNRERAAELAILEARASRGIDRVASLLAIGEIAHKIGGLAGTLGLPEIGATALRLDRAILPLHRGGVDPAALWDECAPLLSRLIADLAP